MAIYWENSCSFGLRYVSWYKYLIVSLVFSHLGFWSGNLFLIAPFPDLVLVPFLKFVNRVTDSGSERPSRKSVFSPTLNLEINAIKFRNRFSKFMIPIALLEKLNINFAR